MQTAEQGSHRNNQSRRPKACADLEHPLLCADVSRLCQILQYQREPHYDDVQFAQGEESHAEIMLAKVQHGNWPPDAVRCHSTCTIHSLVRKGLLVMEVMTPAALPVRLKDS